MSEELRLRQRIQELERELQDKESELAQIRLRLSATNTRLENVIDRVANEIKMAGKVQRLLTPVEIPNISGFEFSTKFVPSLKSGGDYFDIFEHQDRLRFGVVMAASSGYAMSALFLSVLLKLTARMQARQGLEPHEMIAAVAKEVLPELKAEGQASIFYGVVDRRTFELSYCSIGSITALLQAANQDSLTRLDPIGPALSRGFTTQPQSRVVSLNPKDRIILASDGIPNATNPQGQKWNESGLIDAIRSAPRQGVHELRNEVLYRCENFAEKSDPDRDQTFLVFEVKDKVLKLAKN